MFIENTRTAVPLDFNNNGNGSYSFSFMTTTYNFNPNDVNPFIYENSIIVYDDDESAFETRKFPIDGTPRIFMTDQDDRTISEIRFSEPPLGEYTPFQIRFNGWTNNLSGIKSGLIIDSIDISTDKIEILWLGPEGNTSLFNGFPTAIQSEKEHWINLYYTPTEANAYEYAVLTLYFNSGNQFKIPIFAGNNKIEAEPVLELLSPTAGEVLTPCELYEIKWKGHSKDTPVIVQFSKNGGESWEEIGSVRDSVFYWTVPGDITDNGLIRIYQEVSQSPRIPMDGSISAVYDVSFNEFGTELLSINKKGIIDEWDL
jgi:hypothetical protein